VVSKFLKLEVIDYAFLLASLASCTTKTDHYFKIAPIRQILSGGNRQMKKPCKKPFQCDRRDQRKMKYAAIAQCHKTEDK